MDDAPRFDLLAETAAALAGELDTDDVLERIVAAAARVTGAPYAALGVIGDDQTISRFVTYGVDQATIDAIGHYPTGHGILGVLIRDPQTLRLDRLDAHPASYGFPAGHPPMTTFLGVPVRSGGTVYGNLYLTDKTGGFTQADEDLLEVLAAQAGAAIENAELSDRLRSVAVQDERDRISRELHDGVIQTLFSIGLGLESSRSLIDSDPARVGERIDGAIDAIDTAIRDLRTAIYGLRPAQAATMGLRRGLVELVREYEVNAVVRVDLDVAGGSEEALGTAAVPDVLHVVREALSNCAKHAQASNVSVSLRPDADIVRVEVVDDGVGLTAGAVTTGHGLDNMARRAEDLGGTLVVEDAPGGGTAVRLTVPRSRP